MSQLIPIACATRSAPRPPRAEARPSASPRVSTLARNRSAIALRGVVAVVSRIVALLLALVRAAGLP